MTQGAKDWNQARVPVRPSRLAKGLKAEPFRSQPECHPNQDIHAGLETA